MVTSETFWKLSHNITGHNMNPHYCWLLEICFFFGTSPGIRHALLHGTSCVTFVAAVDRFTQLKNIVVEFELH